MTSFPPANLTSLELADTDDVSEGSSNLYFTNARARAAISMEADRFIEYNSSTGAWTMNEALLTSSVRGMVSVTDAGGDGSMAYNASTGVLTYTGPSAAEVRAHMTAGEMLEVSAGVYKIKASEYSASWADALATKNTANLAEGTNLYFTDARARAAVSAVDAGGDGAFAYNASTGVFTYTGPLASEVRAHMTAGEMLEVSSGVYKIKATEFSGSALDVIAHADSAAGIRAKISVTDAGGDGSLAYNSTSGVITYTGPSASEVRAHLSSGEMIDYASGVFSIDSNEFSGSALDVIAHADAAVGVRGHLSVTDTNSMDLSYSGGAFSADLKLNSGDGDASFEVAAGGLRLKSSVAGAGLTLASGVLSLDGAVVTAVGDANATLAEGFNYGSADLTANRTWTLPATPSAGDVVHVKAPLVGSNKLIIAAGAGDSIDGVASIEIESDSGAVSLMAISDAAWRIF